MDDSDPEFGRLILKQRRGNTLLLASLGLLPAGLFLSFSPLAEPEVRAVEGPVLAAAGVVCVIAGFMRRRNTFHLYEQGIVDGKKRLAFNDATELTAALSRITAHGMRGANYEFKIVGQSSAGLATVRFSSGNLGYDMNRAETIIGPISRAIEKKMRASLDQGESVPWGKHGTIQRDSIQFSGNPLLHTSNITEFSLWQGVLTIKTSDGRKATIRSKEPNFFPGFTIVRSMLSTKV